jgi:hypothetical protein
VVASVVVFGGSRSLPSGSAALVGRVVRAVLARGSSVAVGCASGADALVVRAVLGAGAAALLSVFAVGAPSGAGFRCCSVPSWVSAAAASGARLFWLAGGALSVPLRSRLVRRSRASVVRSGAAAAVFFVSSPCSRGSWRCAAFAASRGVPVFAFPVGFAGSALSPLPGLRGSWRRASLAGCFRWCPAPS